MKDETTLPEFSYLQDDAIANVAEERIIYMNARQKMCSYKQHEWGKNLLLPIFWQSGSKVC